MSNLALIESGIREIHLSLIKSAGAHRLHPYEMIMGSDDGKWITKGFYVHMEKGRLVLEVLRYKNSHLVVRVYRENPLETLFAQKSQYDAAQFDRALHGAAKSFTHALPPIVNRAADLEEEEMMGDFSESMPELREVLNPIPPPFDFKSVEEA